MVFPFADIPSIAWLHLLVGLTLSIKVIMQAKSIGCGWEVTQHGQAQPYSWLITIVRLQVLELWCGKYLKRVETELWVHVPWCTCQEHVRHRPPSTKSTYGHCKCHMELSCNSQPFLTLKCIGKNTGNQLQGNSESNWYSLCLVIFVSLLKVSRVFEISRLMLSGWVLLLCKVVIDVMYNTANKLAAFSATTCFGQKVS